ncbi:hypothetical protein [Rhodococcus ruber]|uniref:hypothetical protein n=1 Tax=Rhodococcus ruber TaxID=1830 RepID=UPI003782F957
MTTTPPGPGEHDALALTRAVVNGHTAAADAMLAQLDRTELEDMARHLASQVGRQHLDEHVAELDWVLSALQSVRDSTTLTPTEPAGVAHIDKARNLANRMVNVIVTVLTERRDSLHRRAREIGD